MPPPKKPKNGPTTVEQFLSHEELKNMTCKKEKLQTQSSNGSNDNSSDVEGKNSPLPETSNSGSQQAATGNGDSNNDKSSHKILRKIITTNAEGSVSSVQRSLSSSSDNVTHERDLMTSIKIEQPDSDYENKYDIAATTVSVPSTGNNSTTPTRNGKMKTMAAVQYLKPQEKASPGHFKNHFDTKQTGHSEISRTILTTDHLHIFDQSVVRLPLTDTSVSQPSTSSLYSGMAVPNLPLYPSTVQPPVNNEPFDLSVKKNNIMEMMQNTKLTLSRSEQYGEVISRVGILPQGPVKMPPATLSLSQALYLTGSSAKTASSSISPVSGVHLGDVRSSDALNPHLVVNLLTNRRLSPEDYPVSTVITPRSSSRDSQYPGRDTLPLPELPYGETVETKSPVEDVRMVSPGVCMTSHHSMMVNNIHIQAPTSTTHDGRGRETKFIPPLEPQNSLLLDPQLKRQNTPPGKNGNGTPSKVCQVCNDNASGFHYGVWSCEGCKAFFKRSIQGPVDYVCPATNNCTIDKHRRKSCQACRLRKCYEVGMNKGSQRKERKSSGGGGGGKGKRCRADSSEMAVNSTSGSLIPSKCAKRGRAYVILEALQKADLPVLESFHNHNIPPSRIHLLNTLIKLADRELVYLINWAKHVPGYTDLSLSDQVHLIECCWMELLLLNCAFRSMDHEGKRLVFAPDFHLDRQLWNLTGMTEILEQVAAVSELMVQYCISKEELLLLQATVLVNAEVRRLASFSRIQDMRQVILDALVETSGRFHADNSRHVPSILLLLTHIRQAGERGIAYFQQLKREGCVVFCDLLTEMLEAHNNMGERRVSNEVE